MPKPEREGLSRREEMAWAALMVAETIIGIAAIMLAAWGRARWRS